MSSWSYQYHVGGLIPKLPRLVLQIGQFQPETTDLDTRLWGLVTRFIVFS